METATERSWTLATHNGFVTATNPATGDHRTFQVKTQPEDSSFAPGERVISLLVGGDEETRGFGFVKDGRVILWRKHRDSKAFRAYASMIEDPQHWEDKHDIEYLFEGKCVVCNRRLTHPESIRTGIGPVCAGR